jgi:hypothetical protein
MARISTRIAKRSPARLPEEFPVGSTYVVEARGSVQGLTLMHRYVRLPDGRRIELAARFIHPCPPLQAAAPVPEEPAARRAKGRSRARGAERVT